MLRQAAIDVVGADWKVDTIVDPGAKAEGTPTVTRTAVTPEAESAPEPRPRRSPPRRPRSRRPSRSRSVAAPTPTRSRPRAEASSRPARPTRATSDGTPAWAEADADAHPDDLDADQQGLSTTELLQRELGAQMIEEIKHQ